MGLSRSENFLEKRDAENSGGDTGLSPRLASSWEHVWLGWACAGPVWPKKCAPHTATTPIATAFKICVSHRKNGLL